MNAMPITKEGAMQRFDDCERIRREYKGQQLYVVRFGRYVDLLYQKREDTLGYLTSMCVQLESK